MRMEHPAGWHISFINCLILFTDIKKKSGNNENKQNLMHSHNMHQESTPNSLLHGNMHNQQPNNQQTNIGSIPNHPTNQPLTWSCELCGRMFATRDEWSIHAKSHLEVCTMSESERKSFKLVPFFCLFKFQY